MKKMKPLAFKKFKPQRFDIPAMRRTHRSVDSMITTTIEAGMGMAMMGGALDAITKLKK